MAEGEAYAKSFMYIKNKSGPKTDPWGTPQVIEAMSEDTPL